MPKATPATKHTPLMGKYLTIKKGLPENSILLMKFGDFHEVFFDDACTVSKIWEVALTKRNGIPMCGFPYHMMEKCVRSLVAAGYKVAIAEA